MVVLSRVVTVALGLSLWEQVLQPSSVNQTVPIPLSFGTLNGTVAIEVSNNTSFTQTFDVILDQEPNTPGVLLAGISANLYLPSQPGKTGFFTYQSIAGSLNVAFGPSTAGTVIRSMVVELDLSAVSTGGAVSIVDSGNGETVWIRGLNAALRLSTGNILNDGGYEISGELELQTSSALAGTGSLVVSGTY